ncbi:MAG: hypothetical protein V4613_12865 [Bacteroidota bacterium]
MCSRFFVSIVCGLLFLSQAFADDTTYIKVHFLYGSKPKWAHRKTEYKWFGGKIGGHVGIEIDSNEILNFLPYGRFHWFAHSKNRHSHYALHEPEQFWEILGNTIGTVKKATIVIPITGRQKKQLDSLKQLYMRQTPYDYALAGMRCGSATYEILAQLGILKQYSYKKTYRKIYIPKKLRRQLLNLAKLNHWKVIRQPGTEKRKWEED